MATAHASRSAIADANRAHRRYVDVALRAMAEFRSTLSAQLAAAESDCTRRHFAFERAFDEYREATDADRHHRGLLRDAASRRLQTSRQAVRDIQDAISRFSVVSSRFNETNAQLRVRANQRLTFLDEAIAAYGIGASGGSASGQAAPGRRDSGTSELESFLAQKGMRMVQIEEATFADNPILSWRALPADYAWACEKWDRVVSKAISQGQGRDDLVQRDISSGAAPDSMRHLANVWDIFLGSEAIRLDAKADGTYEVINGRHRLQIARDLGITHLPAIVSDRETT